MRYTQREVAEAMTLQRTGSYEFIASPEAEAEIRAMLAGTEESPILYCPKLLWFYFLTPEGALCIVEQATVSARPCYHHNDMRNYADDPAYFMKFPPTAALDEQ